MVVVGSDVVGGGRGVRNVNVCPGLVVGEGGGVPHESAGDVGAFVGEVVEAGLGKLAGVV